MERMRTKAIVEGAIFAGITTVLGIIYFYTQFLGIVGLLWPVPTVIVGYRNGVKASILSAMSAGLAVSLFTQPLVGVGLLIGFGLPGIVMGYMISKKINPYIIIVLCGLILALTTIGQFVVSLKISGINLSQFAVQYDTIVNSQLAVAMEMYKRLGISESEIQRIGDMFMQSMQMIKLVIPTIIIISGMTSSFVCYKLSRLILNRTGYSIANTESFSRWRLQAPYSFILVGTVVLVVAGSYMNIPGFDALSTNISMVMMMIFTVIGLSVVIYYAGIFGERYGIPKALKIAIVAFILLAFMQFLAFIGIFDMAFNLRRLETEKGR